MRKGTKLAEQRPSSPPHSTSVTTPYETPNLFTACFSKWISPLTPGLGRFHRISAEALGQAPKPRPQAQPRPGIARQTVRGKGLSAVPTHLRKDQDLRHRQDTRESPVPAVASTRSARGWSRWAGRSGRAAPGAARPARLSRKAALGGPTVSGWQGRLACAAHKHTCACTRSRRKSQDFTTPIHHRPLALE